MGSLQGLQSWKNDQNTAKDMKQEHRGHSRTSSPKPVPNLWLWAKLETFLCSFPARLQCSLDRPNLEDPVRMSCTTSMNNGDYVNQPLSKCLLLQLNSLVKSNFLQCHWDILRAWRKRERRFRQRERPLIRSKALHSAYRAFRPVLCISARKSTWPQHQCTNKLTTLQAEKHFWWSVSWSARESSPPSSSILSSP
jgi:hypothetical protein